MIKKVKVNQREVPIPVPIKDTESLLKWLSQVFTNNHNVNRRLLGKWIVNAHGHAWGCPGCRAMDYTTQSCTKDTE